MQGAPRVMMPGVVLAIPSGVAFVRPLFAQPQVVLAKMPTASV
jgi:hypothetical protein